VISEGSCDTEDGGNDHWNKLHYTHYMYEHNQKNLTVTLVLLK